MSLQKKKKNLLGSFMVLVLSVKPPDLLASVLFFNHIKRVIQPYMDYRTVTCHFSSTAVIEVFENSSDETQNVTAGKRIVDIWIML